MFKHTDTGKELTATELQNMVVDELASRSKDKDLFLVGVSGLDASGKSVLAEEIKMGLEGRGLNVLLVSGDSFQYAFDYKNNLVEETWAEQHFKRTINFEKMENDFLQPIREIPQTIKLDLVEFGSGKKIKETVVLNYPLVVIVESIYLFKKDIAQYFDYKVFLDITIETSLKRAQLRKRDLELYGDKQGIEKKYQTKNFPGYLLYQELENPEQYANLVIDANNWDKLKIKKI